MLITRSQAELFCGKNLRMFDDIGVACKVGGTLCTGNESIPKVLLSVFVGVLICLRVQTVGRLIGLLTQGSQQ